MASLRPLLAAALASLCVGADWPGAGADLARAFDEGDAARRVELVAEAAARASEGEAVIVRALSDPSAEVLRAALRRVRRGAGDLVRQRVMTLLADERAAVRAEAASAAGALADARALSALARASGDADAAVRRSAIEAIADIGGDGAAMALLDRVNDPESAVRLAAVRALGALGDARATLSVLGTLEDPNPEVRVAAAYALGRLRDPRSVRALRAALGDDAVDVRLAATRALGALGPDAAEAVDDLAAQALREDRTVDASARGPLARAAIDALAVMAAPRAMELLARIVREGSDEDLRAASDAVGRAPRGDRDAIAARVLPLPPRRADALVDLLGAVGGPAATTALLDRLDARDDREGDPARVLLALGRTGDARALRRILRVAQEGADEAARGGDARDRSARTQCQVSPRFSAAVSALRVWVEREGALPEVALDPVASLLGAPPPSCVEVVATLVDIAGATRNARVGAMLGAHLGHADPLIRAAALRALAAAPGAGVGPALERLSDPSPAVRLAASELLRRRGERAELDALVTALAAPASLDRATALGAAGVIAERVPLASLPPTLPGLLSRYAVDPSAEVSAAALDALARLVARDVAGAVAPLREALGHTSAPRRRVALEALGNALQDPTRSAPAARAMLREAAAAMDPTAAWALRGDPDAASQLLARVDDPRRALAANAAAALAHLASRRVAMPGLAEACAAWSAETREAVRGNLARALITAGAPCAATLAERAMRADEAPSVRRAVASAVALAGGDAAPRFLARCAAGDGSPEVAAHCATLRDRGPMDLDAEAVVAARDAEGALEGELVQVSLADGVAVYAVTGPGGWVRLRGVARGPVSLSR